MNEYPAFCPRCDRAFDSHKSAAESLKLVERHVELAHPDYDPEWSDTNTEIED